MTTKLPYFKTYDIRGVFPEQLDGDAAYRIGTAFAEWSKAAEVIVGRDARLSSPVLTASLIRGLRDAGLAVRDIGLVTTPMLNFAVAKRQRYGLMVTASHNPKEYNGIKIINPKVEQVYYGAGLETLEQLVAGASRPTKGRGRVVVDSVIQDYEAHLATASVKTIFARNRW